MLVLALVGYPQWPSVSNPGFISVGALPYRLCAAVRRPAQMQAAAGGGAGKACNSSVCSASRVYWRRHTAGGMASFKLCACFCISFLGWWSTADGIVWAALNLLFHGLAMFQVGNEQKLLN